MAAHISRFSTNGDGKQPTNKSLTHGKTNAVESQDDEVTATRYMKVKNEERKQKVIQALDSKFKALNKLWEAAEADLKKIHIPVDVIYRYKSEDADPSHPGRYEIDFYLGFVRSKGGWRICFSTASDANPEVGWDWKPITECPLDARLEALPSIGKLRELVLKAGEDCLPTLDKAIEEFRKTLETW